MRWLCLILADLTRVLSLLYHLVMLVGDWHRAARVRPRSALHSSHAVYVDWPVATTVKRSSDTAAMHAPVSGVVPNSI